jgi:RNA polymerase sigma factor (sigma-70 family)
MKRSEFRKAYGDYYPLIYRILYARTGSREDAEDLCHDIFVSLYDKFDGVYDRRAWLLGAARFALSNYYRKKRVTEPESPGMEDFCEDSRVSYENGSREMRMLIRETIADSCNYGSEEDRLIFDLVALGGFTYEQASKQLGLSRRQVEYGYGRVSRRILDALRKKGIVKIEDLL